MLPHVLQRIIQCREGDGAVLAVKDGLYGLDDFFLLRIVIPVEGEAEFIPFLDLPAGELLGQFRGEASSGLVFVGEGAVIVVNAVLIGEGGINGNRIAAVIGEGEGEGDDFAVGGDEGQPGVVFDDSVGAGGFAVQVFFREIQVVLVEFQGAEHDVAVRCDRNSFAEVAAAVLQGEAELLIPDAAAFQQFFELWLVAACGLKHIVEDHRHRGSAVFTGNLFVQCFSKEPRSFIKYNCDSDFIDVLAV